MKFPYIRHLGPEKGWYRVGHSCSIEYLRLHSNTACSKEFEIFKARTNGKPNNYCLHTHWARLIELLHSAEVIKELLRP